MKTRDNTKKREKRHSRNLDNFDPFTPSTDVDDGDTSNSAPISPPASTPLLATPSGSDIKPRYMAHSRASFGSGVSVGVRFGKRKRPDQILPAEVWQNVFRFCDTESLLAVKDCCHQFKEWTKPVILNRLFARHPMLWRLLALTYEKFLELNREASIPLVILTSNSLSLLKSRSSSRRAVRVSGSFSDSSNSRSSGSSSSSSRHSLDPSLAGGRSASTITDYAREEIARAEEEERQEILDQRIRDLERNSQVQNDELSPTSQPNSPLHEAATAQIRELFSKREIHPFVVRLVHLMHKNIMSLTDDTLLSIRDSSSKILDMSAIFGMDRRRRSLGDGSTPTSHGSAGGSPLRSANTPVTSTSDSTANRRSFRWSHIWLDAPRSAPPSKYTDTYENWADFDPSLSGIEQEVNYQQFRSEVGRRGSGVLSRDYVVFEHNRRELSRCLALLVARVWSIFGQRKFPFSHSENREWKERRRKSGKMEHSKSGRAIDGGKRRIRSRSLNSSDSEKAETPSKSERRRTKSQNLK